MPYAIPRALLLAIYAIVPASLIIVGADALFFHGWLKARLPRSPESLLLFVVLFVQPHIMASSGMFCDPQYLRHYGRRLLPVALAVIVITLFFPAVLHMKAFFVFYALWGNVHFTGQQFGVARMMGRGFGRSFTLWRWLAPLMALPIYLDIFSIISRTGELHRYLNLFIVATLLLFLIVSWRVHWTANTRLARYYVLANDLGAVTEILFYFMGYYFFFILIIRVVHDLTAFSFYIVHDANRNAGRPKNPFYGSLRFLRVPVYALCPLIAMAAAFPLTYYGHTEWVYRIVMPLTLFHYYTDGFAWKKGSLHREHIFVR